MEEGVIICCFLFISWAPKKRTKESAAFAPSLLHWFSAADVTTRTLKGPQTQVTSGRSRKLRYVSAPLAEAESHACPRRLQTS